MDITHAQAVENTLHVALAATYRAEEEGQLTPPAAENVRGGIRAALDALAIAFINEVAP
jgi:hypothetical protein